MCCSYCWDNTACSKGPVLDACSQIFSLCLQWRKREEPLTTTRLIKLDDIWRRQVKDWKIALPLSQRLTSWLLQHLLYVWDQQEQAVGVKSIPPEHPKQEIPHQKANSNTGMNAYN